MSRAACLILGVLVLAAGCGIKREPVVMTDPTLELERLAADAWTTATSRRIERTRGSLWQDGGLGELLVSDTRAARLDDLVTIHIVESTKGASSADTKLTRDSTNDFGVPQLFGINPDVQGRIGNLDLADLFRTNTQKEFAGGGATNRASTLLTTITARVFRVFPNGNLAVLGRKEVIVNHERQVLWLAGLVRPEDVEPDNSVISTRIGELSMWLSGEGDVNDNLREGWLTRWLTRVWPF